MFNVSMCCSQKQYFQTMHDISLQGLMELIHDVGVMEEDGLSTITRNISPITFH